MRTLFIIFAFFLTGCATQKGLTLQDIASAQYVGKTCEGQANLFQIKHPLVNGLIDLNGNVFLTTGLEKKASKTKTFTLAHECGHYALKHHEQKMVLLKLFGYGSTSLHLFKEMELAADCWAAKQLIKKGDTVSVLAFISFLNKHSNKSAEHPNSRTRIQHLKACAEKAGFSI